MKKILIADDEKNMRWILEKNLKLEGFKVIEAADGEEAFNLFIDSEPDIVVLDYRMPKIDGFEVLKRIKTINDKIPVIIITAHGSTDAAVEAMKLGAVDYISKPFEIEELKITIKKALNIECLTKEIVNLRLQVSESYDHNIIGRSQKLIEIFKIIEKVADTQATVLINGKSGTGKELIANYLHYKSSRKDKPYIKINCGAIPENLLESELFGYEKGAFTGANSRKIGRFERAEGGTLFLDEIGELSLALQVKILRVLQEHEFERVGGTEVIKCNVRIIAATNRNLDQMALEGKFREDLLYRLKVIPIELPTLKERKEDIPLLVEFFINKYSNELNKGSVTIDNEALSILTNYDFPGNIRELENIIERSVILSSDNRISPGILPKEVVKGSFTSSSKNNTFIIPDGGISLEKVEENFIKQALEISKGNQTQAANLLGISRHALIYRMDKFNLKSKKF